jgi:hypothetical protein
MGLGGTGFSCPRPRPDGALHPARPCPCPRAMPVPALSGWVLGARDKGQSRLGPSGFSQPPAARCSIGMTLWNCVCPCPRRNARSGVGGGGGSSQHAAVNTGRERIEIRRPTAPRRQRDAALSTSGPWVSSPQTRGAGRGECGRLIGRAVSRPTSHRGFWLGRRQPCMRLT